MRVTSNTEETQTSDKLYNYRKNFDYQFPHTKQSKNIDPSLLYKRLNSPC